MVHRPCSLESDVFKVVPGSYFVLGTNRDEPTASGDRRSSLRRQVRPRDQRLGRQRFLFELKARH